jgi:ribosomal protein L11 methyltransferase
MRTDRWLVLDVTSPSAEHAALLSEGLIALGGSAVEEDRETLRTWFAPPADPDTFLDRVRNTLAAIAGQPVAVRWSWRDDEDWSVRWRSGLGPRRVGKRIIVTPSWITPECGSEDIVLTIDPQMAFGTGEHASTRGALRLLDAMLPAGARVLDVGTGSAILALAAVRLGATHVDAIECDPDALVNAAENVKRHGCTDAIRLREAVVDLDYLAGTATAEGPYDVITGNVLSGVLMPLLPGFRGVLRPGAVLILAGIMEYQAEAMAQAASLHRFELCREDRDEGWWSAGFIRLP